MENNKEILHDIETAAFALCMSDQVPKVRIGCCVHMICIIRKNELDAIYLRVYMI